MELNLNKKIRSAKILLAGLNIEKKMSIYIYIYIYIYSDMWNCGAFKADVHNIISASKSQATSILYIL